MRLTVQDVRRLIKEVTEDDREQMISVYSDVYKEKNGIRPHWKYDELRQMSMEELEHALDTLYAEPSMIPDDEELQSFPSNTDHSTALPEPDMSGTIGLTEPPDPHEDEPSHAPFRQPAKRRARRH